MHTINSIPRSVFRNLLILMLSIGLVFATQVVSHRVSAGTVTQDTIDRYLDVLLGGKDFKTECEKPEQESLIDPRDKVELVIHKYHRAVNCLFNTRIKILVEQMLEPEAEKKKPLSKEQIEAMLKNLSPPPLIHKKTGEVEEVVGREECKNDGEGRNLSTYCLSQAVVNEYFAFRRAMSFARRQAKDSAAQRFKTDLTTLTTQDGSVPSGVIEQKSLLDAGKNIQEYGAVMEKIDRELAISREAIDQGLAAYQELQMSLPLHRKYLEVAKMLEKYRDKVADIRDEVSQYPTTFLDVTTTQCN